MSNLLLRRENITSNIFDILFLTIILKERDQGVIKFKIKIQYKNILFGLYHFEFSSDRKKNFELFRFVSFSLRNILTFVISNFVPLRAE